jgi:hypothetical protein
LFSAIFKYRNRRKIFVEGAAAAAVTAEEK